MPGAHAGEQGFTRESPILPSDALPGDYQLRSLCTTHEKKEVNPLYESPSLKRLGRGGSSPYPGFGLFVVPVPDLPQGNPQTYGQS